MRDILHDAALRGVEIWAALHSLGRSGLVDTALRISVSSWATTDADVDRSLEAMVRLAR